MIRFIWFPIVLIGLSIPLLLAGALVTVGEDPVYSYVPEECDMIIHVNTDRIAQKVMTDWIYNPEQVRDAFKDFGDQVRERGPKENGLNMLKPVVMAHEAWADGEMWYMFASVMDAKVLDRSADALPQGVSMRHDGTVAIFAKPYGLTDQQIEQRLDDLIHKRVRSIENRVDMKALMMEEHDVYLVANPALWSPQIGELTGYLDLNDGVIEGKLTGLLAEKLKDSPWSVEVTDQPLIINSNLEIDIAKSILDSAVRIHPFGLAFEGSYADIVVNMNLMGGDGNAFEVKEVKEFLTKIEGWSSPENLTDMGNLPPQASAFIDVTDLDGKRVISMKDQIFWYDPSTMLFTKDSAFIPHVEDNKLAGNVFYLRVAPEELLKSIEVKTNLWFTSTSLWTVGGSQVGPLEEIYLRMDHDGDRISGDIRLTYSNEGVNAVFSMLELASALPQEEEL